MLSDDLEMKAYGDEGMRRGKHHGRNKKSVKYVKMQENTNELADRIICL